MFIPIQVSKPRVKGVNPQHSTLNSLSDLNHMTWITAKRKLNLQLKPPPPKPAGTLLSDSSSCYYSGWDESWEYLLTQVLLIALNVPRIIKKVNFRKIRSQPELENIIAARAGHCVRIICLYLRCCSRWPFRSFASSSRSSGNPLTAWNKHIAYFTPTQKRVTSFDLWLKTGVSPPSHFTHFSFPKLS